jgi:fibronectin-binding autotransporter adhesin
MKTLRLAITGALLVFSSSHLLAAPLYWDADGTAVGNDPTSGAGLGGSGNWDQTSALWFDGGSDVPWMNANGDTAIFSGTAGTVTLTENISAGNVSFTNAAGNYVITNATGAEVLTIAGAIDTGGGEHTIGAPIANSGTLTKNGAGRLHLPADNGATLNGSIVINQGDISVENNNAVGSGSGNSITVADGAALVLNGGSNGLTAFYPTVTINGSGITNSGALRNLSGVTTFYGQIILATNNSVIYVDSGSALVYDGEYGPLTDNGNNYNLIISASGTGNFHMGATSIGGTLMIEGPASCYADLTSITPTDWESTYISLGGTAIQEPRLSARVAR